MSSASSTQASTVLLPLSENHIILGCGAVSVDYLVRVASYPKPDDKIRSTGTKVDGGGNAGTSLTCAACLGLYLRLITKVADDFGGKYILEQLEADGVDTSFIVASHKNIPILMDLERTRKGLDALLNFTSFAVCAANFSQASLPVL
ncbi:ribokinase [Forsythia ovata]|uniref:Ribokinase n=1 Tax=Forsythia ovata TaxID=205694 RepID=A0ABD1RIS7_9LAMI